MPETTHSPLPWEAEIDGIHSKDGFIGSLFSAGRRGAPCDMPNEAFIVRAVNSHAKLVTALREIANHTEKWEPLPKNWRDEVRACTDCGKLRHRTYGTRLCDSHYRQHSAHEKEFERRRASESSPMREIARVALLEAGEDVS